MPTDFASQDVASAAAVLSGQQTPAPDTSATTAQTISNAADSVTGAQTAMQGSAPINSRPPVPNPVQPAPKKPSLMSDILHAVGEVLGGPSTTKRVNPQTGVIEEVPLSRAGRIANTAGIYLRGAAAGAAQHGPGATGKAALAGAQEQQQFQQQQLENSLSESKNVQAQLAEQASHALQQQQIAESGFRMARLGTEMDETTAEKFNAMQTLLASNPDGNHLIAHFNSFADLLDAHPDLQKAGINIPQLQAQGKLRSVVTTKNGKSTGIDVYMVNPDWDNQKISAPITVRRATGLDQKGDPIYREETIPAGSVTNGQALQYLSAAAKSGMDNSETSARVKLQKAQTAEAEAGTAQRNAEANLVNTQAKTLINAGQADPFGTVPTLPQKELLKRQDSFQKDTVNKAYDTEKAFQMSQQAFSEYQAAAKQGKELPTGAQSMLLLSQHLGTTFGGIKGSRITKDLIAEHLGARGITDDAVTAVQRLVNGDQLSSAQWTAFSDLITQSRNATWENAISSAKNQQLPITFLPRGNGRSAIDKNTAQLYLDAAGGDWQKATAAAQKQGWLVQ